MKTRLPPRSIPGITRSSAPVAFAVFGLLLAGCGQGAPTAGEKASVARAGDAANAADSTDAGGDGGDGEDAPADPGPVGERTQEVGLGAARPEPGEEPDAGIDPVAAGARVPDEPNRNVGTFLPPPPAPTPPSISNSTPASRPGDAPETGSAMQAEPLPGAPLVSGPVVARPPEPGDSTEPRSDRVPEPTPEPEPEPTPEPPSGFAPEPSAGAAEPSDGSADVIARHPVIGARRGDVTRILAPMRVSKSQVHAQQTPVDTQHGYVYTANIEVGPDGDVRGDSLLTVLRQGVQDADGAWRWTRKVIDDGTIKDRWHTAPSVAADADGHVHVVYNMHNIPWQYQRSDAPHAIDAFTFRGQAISEEEKDRNWRDNKTSFPTLGTAEIPGNQITYPSFYKNNANDLYVTYRHAATPKRRFAERTMSGGIARYDTASRTWRAIGGRVEVTPSDRDAVAGAPDRPTAIAGETGWTVYHPRLMFDADDSLYVQNTWRSGTAGSKSGRVCVLRMLSEDTFVEMDGSNVEVPMRSGDCGNVGYPDSQAFYTLGSTAMDSAGTPHLLLSPQGGNRQILSWDAGANAWTREDAPGGATEIFFDADDTLWAIGSGVKIHQRERGASRWTQVHEVGGSWCYPQSSLNEEKSIAYIHTQSCDETEVQIHALRLR